MGIAVDNQGHIYVADARNQRVQKFTPGGEFQVAFGAPGTGPGQFEAPAGLAVDAQGHVYVGMGRPGIGPGSIRRAQRGCG